MINILSNEDGDILGVIECDEEANIYELHRSWVLKQIGRPPVYTGPLPPEEKAGNEYYKLRREFEAKKSKLKLTDFLTWLKTNKWKFITFREIVL